MSNMGQMEWEVWDSKFPLSCINESLSKGIRLWKGLDVLNLKSCNSFYYKNKRVKKFISKYRLLRLNLKPKYSLAK